MSDTFLRLTDEHGEEMLVNIRAIAAVERISDSDDEDAKQPLSESKAILRLSGLDDDVIYVRETYEQIRTKLQHAAQAVSTIRII